jgi:hypothetical protein
VRRQACYDAKRLGIALKSLPVSLFVGQPAKLGFSGVPERRVAQIVDERSRFHHVWVDPSPLLRQLALKHQELLGNPSRDLSSFEGVR